MGNKTQHNELVDYLEDNFERMFFKTPISKKKNLTYGLNDYSLIGEIDLLIETPDTYYLFEMKSGKNDKAHYKLSKKQLLRHKNYFGFNDKELQMWYIRGKVGNFTGKQVYDNKRNKNNRNMNLMGSCALASMLV